MIVLKAIRKGWALNMGDYLSPRKDLSTLLETLKSAEATGANSDVDMHDAEAPLPDRATSSDDPRGSAAAGSADKPTVVADLGPPIVVPSGKKVLPAAPLEGEASVVGAVVTGRRVHTKGAATKAAVAATQAERSKAENTLHAVGRMLCKNDLRESLAMVVLATEPYQREHAMLSKHLRSASGTAGHYIGWAHSEYMWTLKACVRTGADYRRLKPCGFMVDFNKTVMDKLGGDSLVRGYQQHRMAEYWRLVFNLVRSHASQWTRCMRGMPYILAGLLDARDEKRAKSMALFRSMIESWEVAQTKPDPVLVDMCRSSQLNTTVAQFAVLFFKAGGCEKVTPQLRALLEAIFYGFGESSVVENQLKELRERETRDSNRRSLGLWASWSACVEAETLRKFGREEVKHLAAGSVPADFTEGIFAATHSESRSQDSIDLKSVTKPCDWLSPSTLSVRNLYAQAVFLMYLHEHDKWGRAADGYMVTFLPEGEVVTSKDSGTMSLVVKVFDKAALLWPMQQQDDVLSLDMDIAELTWTCCVCLDDILVAPTAPCSPVELAILGLENKSGF